MKIAAISELKAKLSRYLRLVKSGDEIEIHERGIPVAILRAIDKKNSDVKTIPPRKDPKDLAKYSFTVHPKTNFDVVALLLEERS